jgi:hypothetical protein
MTDTPRRSISRLRAIAGFVLLAFVTVVGIGFASQTKPVPSTLDGRTLAGFPAPHRSTLADGSWMKLVETWTDDRILGRQAWLSIHAKISASVLRVQEINGIAIDRTTGLQLEKPPTLTPNGKLGDYAQQLGDAARAAGAVPLFVYVPRKEESFADLLPPTWTNTYQQADTQVKADLARGGQLLDLSTLLSDPATRLQDYYLTDHHWTPQGAMVGLNAIAGALAKDGVDVGPAPSYSDVAYKEFFGSYARRITAAGSPKGDPFAIPTPKVWTGQLCRSDGSCGDPVFPKYALASDLYANRYAAFLGGDQAMQTLVNTDPRAKGTIVILKDSYGLPLVTYLAQRVHKVIAIDERKYTGPDLATLFAKERPNAVVVMHNIRTLLGDASFDARAWVDMAAVLAARHKAGS